MSDEQNLDAAEQWRKEQLEKLQSDPDAALGAIKQVLGEELFEKTFGAQQKPKEPEHKPQLDADGVTVLNVIDRMQRLPKAVDRAVETLKGVDFAGEVKQFVVEELEKLSVDERAKLSEDDILAATRLAAGLMALKRIEESNQQQPAPEPAKQEDGEETPEKPTVPEYMKAPRATIMAMKDALLSHGYTEEQVEAMCND